MKIDIFNNSGVFTSSIKHVSSVSSHLCAVTLVIKNITRIYKAARGKFQNTYISTSSIVIFSLLLLIFELGVSRIVYFGIHTKAAIVVQVH